MRKTSSYIYRALSELGFTVDVAASGTEGLHLAVNLTMRPYSGRDVARP
jgi:DNA-binding response OmpR family regulator